MNAHHQIADEMLRALALTQHTPGTPDALKLAPTAEQQQIAYLGAITLATTLVNTLAHATQTEPDQWVDRIRTRIIPHTYTQ